MSRSPHRADESEDCGELDDNYFTLIGNTFSVVDQWNENEEVEVKTEPDEESNHSKSSSRKSNNKDPETRKTSSSRDSRSNTRSERGRVSPERRRSPVRRPERGRNRFSPERSRISPRRSPIRNWNFRDDRFRRSPPRNAGQFDRRRPISPDRNRNQHAPAKKPFLLEMQEKFLQDGIRDPQIEQMIQQGGVVDLNSPDLRPEPPRNFQNQQFHFNNQQNQMPPFMNDQMMPQHFNPMMMQQMPPMQNMPMQPNMMNMPNMPFPSIHTPPAHSNMFMSPLEIMQPAPLPVPPPQIDQMCAPGVDSMPFPQISPPIVYQNSNNGIAKQPVTIVRENTERPSRKKTPSESGQNLIDILRQKSKQNIRTSGDEELASKKAKVLERCKAAIGSISDFEQNKSKLPLTCVLSNQTIHKPNIFVNKSPLLLNESNPRYLFQATPDQCFSALENHPLRNIYGETAEIAQALKLDLLELSSNVARESIIRPATLTTEPVMPSTSSEVKTESISIFGGKKTSNREVQTEPLTCKRCHQMDMIKQSGRSRACQTNEAIKISTEVQCDNTDENEGFRVFIDAQTIADRNFEQHHALEVFSKAFNIQCPIIDRNRSQEQAGVRREETDERWTYTNPENPNQVTQNENFFSTSPIQSRPTLQTIFKGTKSPPRFHRSKSPPKFVNLQSPQQRGRSNSPQNRYRNSPQHINSPTMGSNSPPHHRNSNSPQRIRQHRSVFERIGEKIPDHEDSPRNYENWDDDDYDNSQQFRPYKIPSPRYAPTHRDRSPEMSRNFRNKSRSRSLSRSRSRSPKRFRGGNKILNRRGRY